MATFNRSTTFIAVLLALGLCACGGEEPKGCSQSEGEICSYMGNGESGLGSDGMAPLEVSLYLPQDLTFGPDDQPYVLDWNNHRVRTIADDKVETVTGTGDLGDAPTGPWAEA